MQAKRVKNVGILSYKCTISIRMKNYKTVHNCGKFRYACEACGKLTSIEQIAKTSLLRLIYSNNNIISHSSPSFYFPPLLPFPLLYTGGTCPQCPPPVQCVIKIEITCNARLRLTKLIVTSTKTVIQSMVILTYILICRCFPLDEL